MGHTRLIWETFQSSRKQIGDALSEISEPFSKAIDESIEAIDSGGILYFAGNGGSAADCSHVAGELVGSFESITTPLPAVALTTDTAVLTSVGNDFSFDSIFLQQVRALMRTNDLLWLISTSGESGNLILAAEWASEHEVKTVGLLGKDGGTLASMVDHAIIVPGDNTQRIQEIHILILHILASALKKHFGDGVG